MEEHTPAAGHPPTLGQPTQHGFKDVPQSQRDLFAILARRRSCRRFSPRPVEADLLLQMVQAGALAPSSGNLQNWGFIIVTDVEVIRNLYHHTLEQEPFLTAMAAIVVTGDTEYAHTMYGMRGKRLYTVQNCAAATENMLLAAEALGLGAIWIGAFDEDKICDIFGIPNEKYRPQSIVLIGYPAYEPEPRHLRNLDNIAFWNKFGLRIKRPHLMYFDWATEWQKVGKKVKQHAAWIGDSLKGKKESEKEAAPLGHDLTTEPAKQEEKKAALDAVREKTSESMHKTRSTIRDVINKLKKDEYQEKK